MLIKDTLTINLSEDIKNVIDLEDISDAAILSEIENYIVTEGLAKEYERFVNIITSNIVETGVWISGFYGSGKSYFGKLLGYLLNNRIINGTPARDRILQRFNGIENEALVKNSISKLNSIESRVVFLDIAKQDTTKGLSYTLFKNFLKSLELPENEHGFLLYSLMCDASYSSISDFLNDKTGEKWSDLKTNRMRYIPKIKELYVLLGNSEQDYNNTLTTIRREIDEFSPSTLKDELYNYLNINKTEKIVFLFDEASEAITQKKIDILQLEGLSEALSALGGKVWTVAIAQEKLDDVISNSNVNKAMLTKVTDRFKTKVHLESTEVDVIIRSRLLKKNESSIKLLEENYQKNSGKIADHSNLTGATKTEEKGNYVTYYPFYKYQFDLMQNFLFGTKGYTSTKVAARGMIITTYDILKKQLQNEELYNVVRGWQITSEAQQQPDVRIVNCYTNAERIVTHEHISLSGRRILETIHFLFESEVVPPTFNNILKSLSKEPEEARKIQKELEQALELLVNSKILLLTDGKYRITSDLEQRLLDEMNQYAVQIFKKKAQLINAFQNSSFIKTLSRINDNNNNYEFYITSDNEDELTKPPLKQLKIKVKSLYTFSEDYSSDIEKIKNDYQNSKDIIWLVPDYKLFKDIDKLLEEIERIKYLEEKYTNLQSEEGSIVSTFRAEKSSKEIRLKEIIEQTLFDGSAVYLYNISQLDKNNWHNHINKLQREVIQNVYSKRLSSQLTDEIAPKIIKEENNQRLHTFFTSQGADFQFFDDKGNFIGEKLKPAEEILFILRNTFVDGATLEKQLIEPPTGFQFGTVISTVASLMRGNRVIAKHNGQDKYSWRDAGVESMFNAREFRRASFKAISKTLTALQKDTIVKSLRDLEIEKNIDRKIDWNTNDFDLVNSIRELAKRFIDKVDDMKRQNADFDEYFVKIENYKNVLSGFTGSVSEGNYIEKAENYINNKQAFENAVLEIIKVENFIRNNLSKVREYKFFVKSVIDELNKAAKTDTLIHISYEEFKEINIQDIVNNFNEYRMKALKIKDAYYSQFRILTELMADKYIKLKDFTLDLLSEIDSLPKGINEDAKNRAKSLLQYAEQRCNKDVVIDFDVRDKNTRFTYSEILSFIELFPQKSAELDIIKAGLLRKEPEKTKKSNKNELKQRLFSANAPYGKIKIADYKFWLTQELQRLASADDNDEIEIKAK